MAGEGSTRTTQREIGGVLPEGRPPGRRHPLLRRLRRSKLGLATLLPGLALAAVFVASPFSGSHAIDQPTPTPSAALTYPPGTGSGR